MNKLSIIIPVYNASKYLKRCVDTLYMQDLDIGDFEVIMVNDGSTDNSYEIAQKIEREHSNIKLFTQENAGSSVARNNALDHAQGKNVIFVDSDDFLIPGTLKRILLQVEKDNTDIFSYKMLVNKDTDYYLWGNNQMPKNIVMSGEKALFNKYQFGSVCISVYSLDFINKHHLRFFSGILSQDVDFNMRAYAYANRVEFTDLVSYYYYKNPNSSTSCTTTSKFKKRQMSNITIAKRAFDISKSISSATLKKYYLRYSISVILSLLCKMSGKNSEFSDDLKMDIINQMKDWELIPIKGRSLSWKSSLTIPFFNWKYNSSK
jgi:glycosyltransferase involved in cell wall biosynthesis